MADDGGLEGRLGAVDAVVADYLGDLWLMKPDGTATPLVRGGLSAGNPRWSPAGTSIAFVDGHAAYVAELDGGSRRVVTDQGGKFRGGRTDRAEWNADGTVLAVDGTDNDSDADAVFLTVVDGGEPDYVGWADGWAWAPDGRSLLTSASGTPAGQTVYLWDLASRDAGVVRPGRLLDASPRGAVAVQEDRLLPDGGTGSAVVVYLPDGGSPLLFPLGSMEVLRFPRTRFRLSPYADEAAAVVVDSSERLHLVRVSFDGEVLDLLQASYEGALPVCFRFVPGGVFLSVVMPGDPSSLVLISPDGGEEKWGARGVNVTGDRCCLDWRERR